ncbi:hypothetical protein LOAG_17905 [Loa loa]|uniref:Uncharacterized protein n=1 Tax=Loa loa TaxID=7209 RepID=A0A1S0UGX2_LOALO|nr:hypothetical protein LOAG_17905 [Loa loa]EJD74835.1 hypothetical protein LOAG_17905 [Loa loa]
MEVTCVFFVNVGQQCLIGPRDRFRRIGRSGCKVMESRRGKGEEQGYEGPGHKLEDISCILLPTNSTAGAFMTDRYSDEGVVVVNVAAAL